MTTYTVEIQPDLIQRLGRTEPVKAIGELIWNGFDADADRVDISLDYDDLGGLSAIRVTDNGHGINHSDARTLFQNLGGSWKKKPFEIFPR